MEGPQQTLHSARKFRLKATKLLKPLHLVAIWQRKQNNCNFIKLNTSNEKFMRTKLRAKVIWSRRRRRWLDWDWIWSSTLEGPPTAHMGAREPKRGLASEQKCSRPSNCVPAVAVCDLHTDSHKQKGKHRSILFGPCASRRRRYRALDKDEHCS